jgi:predicted HTH transcriptional regulator
MARAAIKDRQITIYVPKLSDVTRWHELSKAAGISISRWVFEMVELALEERPPKTPSDSEEITRLRKQVLEQEREIEQLNKFHASSQLLQSASEYLSQVKPMEEKVRAILQKGGIHSGERLMNELSIDFIDGHVDRKTVYKILQQLIDDGLVKEIVGHGFKWIAKN